MPTITKNCQFCGRPIQVDLFKPGSAQELCHSDSEKKSDCQIMNVHLKWIERLVAFLLEHGTSEAKARTLIILNEQARRLV